MDKYINIKLKLYINYSKNYEQLYSPFDGHCPKRNIIT